MILKFSLLKKSSLKYECILNKENNTEIKYLVELAMTKEEYEKFIKMIDGK